MRRVFFNDIIGDTNFVIVIDIGSQFQNCYHNGEFSVATVEELEKGFYVLFFFFSRRKAPSVHKFVIREPTQNKNLIMKRICIDVQRYFKGQTMF